MKRNSFKVLAVTLIAVCLFSFSACTKTTEFTGPEAFAADVVSQFVDSMVANQENLDALLDTYQTSPLNYDSILNYKLATEEMGVMVSKQITSVTETDDGVYLVRGVAEMENGQMDLGMELTVAEDTVNRVTGEVTYGIVDAKALTLDRIKSTGEKLENAALNTLLGMGTVFIVLVLIAVIIYLFSYINKYEAKLADKKNAKNAPAVQTADIPAAVVEETPVADDTELVAVIAAAIAAFEGTSPDGIVVRSIRRVSSNNKWKRG